MNSIEIANGRVRLTFTWQRHGPDLSVHIGGGAHHIGAVALVGRRTDGTVYESVACLAPHKEDAAARSAAKAIHEATGATVCVSMGIHFDEITEAEIVDVLRTVDEGVARLVPRLREKQT